MRRPRRKYTPEDLARQCPACHVPPGRKCVKPLGGQANAPHAVRRDETSGSR